jgi:lipopolysaccharide export system protein LptA
MTNPRNSKGPALLCLFLAVPTAVPAYQIDDDREVSAKKPVNISASQMTVDRVRGLTFFKKKVTAIHDQVILTADQMCAISDNQEATAEGHVHVVDPTSAMTLTCGNLEYLDLMETMTAHDQPVLTSVDNQNRPVTITGRQMELDSARKTIVVNQNVKIDSADGQAESQKATLLAGQDELILEDGPKMRMSNAQLSGRRIVSQTLGERKVIVEGMAEAIFNPSGKAVTEEKAQKGGGGNSPSTPTQGGNPTRPPGGPSPSGPSGGTSQSQSPAIPGRP